MFACGMKMTTADFAVAGLAFAQWRNKAHPGGDEWADMCQEVIDTNHVFKDYLDRLEAELRPMLIMRKSSPF